MQYALITGASKGIGKAMAETLAQRKHNLILVARSQVLLETLALDLSKSHGILVQVLALDLASTNAPQQIVDFIAKHKLSVNILINNAGFGYGGAMMANSDLENTAIINLNITALTRLSHAMVPLLQQNKPAHILNVASTAAYQAVPYLAIYAATKVFVLNYSRALRQELAPTGVHVSVLCPGGTNTEFSTTARLGEKALKTGEKVNMSASEVAQIGIAGMLAAKAEIVPGILNKLNVFGSWLLPKVLIEKIAGNLYK
jgi:uncharacterized protein